MIFEGLTLSNQRTRPVGPVACLVACLLVLLGSTAAASIDGEPALQRAVNAYNAAQAESTRDARLAGFARASKLFIAAGGPSELSPDLHFNAGTAALQAEELGTAVLHFRRALAREPAHQAARRNLIAARGLLPAWVPRPQADPAADSLFSWHRHLPPASRLPMVGGVFAISALVLAWGIAFERRGARSAGYLGMVAWAILGAGILSGSEPSDSPDAVIVTPEATVRASDSGNAPTRFAQPLPGGTEVRVLDQRPNWLRISVADGRDGWVRRWMVQLISTSPAARARQPS